MGAPAARVSELAQHWAEDGHDVTVLTGFPNHPTGVLHPAYRERFRRLIYHEYVGRVHVARTWLLPLPNRKPHERILNYSSFFLSSCTTGTFLARPDVVIASSPQLLVGLTGYWLATVHRVPFVFEVRDLWPESLEAVGLGDRHSPMNRALRAIASFLYAQADHIVVVTPAFRDHLRKHRGLSPERISVVVNGVETDKFTPEAVDPNFREQLGVDGKFVVGYIGTVGMAHGLETLVQAAATLRVTNPEVVFLVVGEGAEKRRIEKLAREQSLKNIVFVDQQPRERIPRFINACDACLVMLRKTEVFKTVIPSKMLEFMACGRPILVAVDGQARAIVECAKAGLFVEPENADALVDAIRTIQTRPELRDEMGRSGRSHILSHYCRRQTANAYLELLDKLVGARQATLPRSSDPERARLPLGSQGD